MLLSTSCLANPVFEIFRKQRRLAAINTFNKTLQHISPATDVKGF